MGKEITAKTSETPPTISPVLYRAILAAQSGHAMTPSTCEAAKARLSTLSRSLAERSAEQISRAVLAMLVTFPSASGSGLDGAKVMVAAYASALADLPPWAVVDATKRWTQGRAGASPFPPSSAQLYEMASEIVRKLSIERAQLETAIALPPPETSPEERQRVVDKFERLQADLGTPAATKADRARNAGDIARESLRQTLSDLGHDPALLDAVPDAKRRSA